MTTPDHLPSHETLLAVGVTLVMTGLILRGFASSARRELARRQQHARAERKSGAAALNADLERPPSWLELNLGRIANGVLAAGVVVTVLGFLR